jgi:tyrosyl-DNA phosphodiesterase 2
VASPPLHPAQIAASARNLQGPKVHAGILAGDFNAIEDFGRAIPIKHKLTNAYLVFGGWYIGRGIYTGIPVQRGIDGKFVASSTDKVLFGGGIRVDGLKRIAVGAKVQEAKRNELRVTALTITPGQLQFGEVEQIPRR